MEIVRRRGMRTGYTTGACAAAAAAAATRALLGGTAVDSASIWLPAGREATFAIARCELGPDRALCGVVKDAGDDPDVTHGAEICATVWRRPASGIELRGGEGVGRVTLPGLGLEIGGPAINPVPRRMILDEVSKAAGAALARGGLVVEISVPRGEEIAKRTLNARLGIVGGISILGTTGIVRPFSTAAYRASVVQQIDVAAAQGERTVLLATGSRSERAATGLHPELDDVCCVEVGDFTGIALRRAVAAGIERVVFVGMAGKIAKLAAGVMMTHFHRSRVDGDVLAAAARAARAPAEVIEAATETETARHYFEVCVAQGAVEPLRLLCEQAAAACRRHVDGALEIEVVMVDFDGAEVIARA